MTSPEDFPLYEPPVESTPVAAPAEVADPAATEAIEPPVAGSADQDLGQRLVPVPSPTVQEWLVSLHTMHVARVTAEIGRGVPWKVVERRLPREQRSGTMSEAALAVAAAVPVERLKRKVLERIGLRCLGDPPFDQFALGYLPAARAEAREQPPAALSEQLDRYLGRADAHRKRIATGPAELQREELAWALARAHAQDDLMGHAARTVTREELDAVTAEYTQAVMPTERHAVERPDVSVVDANGKPVSSAAVFAARGVSPFSLEEWCTLPTRPVVSPAGTPGPGAAGLATFLFDRVLYSNQVCDRNGQAVGLSPQKRQEYLDKITYAIEHDLPVTASEYVPLVAISNPIKRNTQAPALAEVDVLRRLSEIAHAVELYYPPGMRWLIGNEATAFQGPNFNLSTDYVGQFQEECRVIMRHIDPTGTRLALFDEADVLWGTPTRQAQWKTYEACRQQELREAYAIPGHPDHEPTRRYISTYVYPMATCISPYQFEAAQDLPVWQIAEVYEAIKATTGSVIRGVGSIEERPEPSAVLSPAQAALRDALSDRALDLTFQYRVTMDSRDDLPAFREVIPPYTVAYTMVTKRDKMVLYPNSGRGAYFPAHGEPVLVRPRDARQRTAVTVRPWWQIAGAPDRYVPMYVAGRDEPLYFEDMAER